MTIHADPAAESTPLLARPQVPVRKESRPVVWWAAVGVVFTLFALYVQGRWLLGGDAHHVGTGVTPVPTYAKISVRVHEIVFGLGILACFAIYVVRAKIRTGRLGLAGLLFLAFFTVWWQDPLFNYTTTGFTYNSYFLNLGGWGEGIPGWGTPNGREFAEPLIWDLGFYIFLSLVGCLGFSAAMRKAQARWPRLGTGPMLVGLFVIIMLIDFALEFFWVLTGLYAYAGTHNSLTIFADEHYRFPLYEPLLASQLFIGWVCLIHFRNDRGETLVERGVSKVAVSEGGRQWLRFFALSGGLNLIFLFFNNVPVNTWQHHIDQWPAELQEKSYMTHDLCGAGTTYPCGGTNTSIPRGGKEIHVGPDGALVVPPGATVPLVVPHAR